MLELVADEDLESAFKLAISWWQDWIGKMLSEEPDKPVPIGTILQIGKDNIFRHSEEAFFESEQGKHLIKTCLANSRLVRLHGNEEYHWRCGIEKYLRHRSVLKDMLDGKEMDLDELYKDFEARVFSRFEKEELLAPLWNFRLNDYVVEDVIECGRFNLRKIKGCDLDDLWERGYRFHMPNAVREDGDEAEVACVLLQRHGPAYEEITMTGPPLKPAPTLGKWRIFYANASEREFKLPGAEYSFLGELLRLNLFAIEPVYITEAYLNDVSTFGNVQEIQGLKSVDIWDENSQTFSPEEVGLLKEWIKTVDENNLLTTPFLQKSPELFFALTYLLEGDFTTKYAYADRLLLYIRALESLYCPTWNRKVNNVKEPLGKDVANLLSKFGLKTDLVIDESYKTRNDLLHGNRNIIFKKDLSRENVDNPLRSTVDQLRNILRCSILCFFSLFNGRPNDTHSKLVSWMREASLNEIRRQAGQFSGLISYRL